MQVDTLVWTLCGEVERRITFEPSVSYETSLAVARLIDFRNPEFYYKKERMI